MKVAVQVKRLDGSISLPKYQTSGAAGFDLAVKERVELAPGQSKLVGTGLVISTPPGHMLLAVPRSSTWNKYGLVLGNTVAIIDEDYCGDDDEIMLNLWNPNTFSTGVSAGIRIAQGILVPVTRAEFVETDKMGQSRGGLGSTG